MKKFIIEVSMDGYEFQNIYGDYVEALDYEQALEFYNDWIEETSEHTVTLDDYQYTIKEAAPDREPKRLQLSWNAETDADGKKLIKAMQEAKAMHYDFVEVTVL